MAEEMTRDIVMVTELVAGRIAERIFYPDLEPLPAEHDYAEARALATVVCAGPSSIAFIRFAEAEAEALIRSNMSVATAFIDALVEHGTLAGEQVDRIISDAIAVETLAAEHARRREMQMRAQSAAKFTTYE